MISTTFKRLKWITHPITIFVSLQIVWLAMLLIWVIWFVGQQALIAEMAQRFGHEYFSSTATVTVLVVGCVLLGVLLFGTIMLFVFGQRQSYLARQHRNFVSSVTHELKSPLASLQLAFDTLFTRVLDPTTTKRLGDMIDADIDRLRRLVDQILLAGRLDKGMLSFDEENHEIQVADLIGKISEKLTYLDPELARRLTVDCPASLTMRGSRSALTLILNNLMENAIKYSSKETPIQVGAALVGDKTVQFFVKDRGLGLDKKDARRVFKMFHRNDSAIKKAIPGTGLGLYIVKSAVKMLGGRVWVESLGPGQGSTFYVSLPNHDRYPASGKNQAGAHG